MQLSIHKRYLRTNTQNTIVVNSTPYESHIRRRYSNLEIYVLPLTDTVQIPVNGPCKSRYLAKNVICTRVLSFNIQLYHCIPLFPSCIYTIPTCQTLITLITLIIESFLSSEQITLTLSVQRPYLLTYSYDIVLLYSIGCIRPIPTCRTLITLITLIIESFLSSEQITLTLSVQRPYLLIHSYDIAFLYSLGCIHPIPTWQTLITQITLLTESFLTIWTDNVQLPVNGPCKSRYLAINVICTTVLSLNIQLYHGIAVFPRLHPNTNYLPNTDDTDYTDNRVVFIIWTDNVNAICTTTISSDIQLWYCIAVFPRLYPSNTYLPNTDYTDYTDNRVVFIIWTDNVNAICTTTISSDIQLWCCIAVFPRLYRPNTYLPNTDYTDYTAYRVVCNHLHR